MNFIFFWNGPFSQWFLHDMVIDGVKYNCCEQYMMAEKARLFNDDETLALIMEAHKPRDQKRLGRQVKNFDLSVWNKHCRQIVYKGNYYKFLDPLLNEYLFSFDHSSEFVEASPLDNIWGIGLSEDDPRALNKSTWLGTNWLGEAITQVRDTLIKEKT